MESLTLSPSDFFLKYFENRKPLLRQDKDNYRHVKEFLNIKKSFFYLSKDQINME